FCVTSMDVMGNGTCVLNFVLVFITMTLRPNRTPYFPYTTLFRSAPVEATTGTESLVIFLISLKIFIRYDLPVPGNPVMNRFCLVDRKSTRLNSSHVKISYAVFCLKKKKINNTFAITPYPNLRQP